MRRFLLFLIVLLVLSGCGKASVVPRLQDAAWSLSSVQSVEQKGKVIACRPGEGASWGNPNALEIEWEGSATEDALVFVEMDTEKKVTAEIRWIERTPESNIYEVKIGGQTGIAVTAMTAYADQSRRPTFILKLDEYVLNFGKHAGKTLPQIAEIDSGYIAWAKENMTREPIKTLLAQM